MKRYAMRALFLLALCTSAYTAATPESQIPVEARRSVEQTFLTFPEWFLVHSPAEYAIYVSQKPAHGFPFIGYVGQLWSSYASVVREQVREDYPANLGYHVMILVLASSTTMEYSLRWAYENTLGRLSWASSSGHLTPEDQYGAQVAQDYVNFIRHEPWYLYDFKSKLKGLWKETPVWGDDMIRKWERRYALTTEYVIKAAYGWIIEKATRAAYEPALMTTQIVVNHAPPTIPAGLNIRLLRTLPDGRALMSLPRYFDFRIAVTALAEQGVSVIDIAGNTSVILVTAWVAQGEKIKANNARVLFEHPLLTMPGTKRVGIILPVSELSSFLLHARDQSVRIEHVYDY